jgi:hypothetical protein
LRRLPQHRGAEPEALLIGRTEPRGQGSRPQRAAPVPRVREEGAGGGGRAREQGLGLVTRSPQELRRRNSVSTMRRVTGRNFVA